MKKLCALMALMLGFAFAGQLVAQEAAAPAVASNEKNEWIPDVTLTLEWDSKYTSKGFAFNPDAVMSVDLYVSLKGFYVEIWDQNDMTGYNDGKSGQLGYQNKRKCRAEEIDYILGYGNSFDAKISKASWYIQWAYYQYPRLRTLGEHSFLSHYRDEEIDAGFKLDDVLGDDDKNGLALGMEVSYDLEGYAWFGKFFGDYSYVVSERVTLGLKNTWFWRESDANEAAYDHHKWSMVATEVRPYVDINLCDNVSANIFAALSWSPNGHVRKYWRENSANNRVNTWVGGSIAFSF